MFTQELFVILFGWATLLSGYTPSETEPLPEIVYNISAEWWVENRCGGKEPCYARALYLPLPHPRIYISEVANEHDPIYANSFIVHEYVHYLADVHHELDLKECERGERKAYAAQQAYLVAMGSDIKVRFKPKLDCT